MPPTVIYGVDASLSATGLAALRFEKGRVSVIALRTVATKPSTLIGERLRQISAAVEAFFAASLPVSPRDGEYQDHFAIEDFSRGSRFHREEMGMVAGVVRLKVLEWANAEMKPIPIREAKKLVCPAWPGLCKANWTAAGYEKKFKLSMPDKGTVMARLFKTYRINAPDEHQADASCVAIACAVRLGLLLAR